MLVGTVYQARLRVAREGSIEWFFWCAPLWVSAPIAQLAQGCAAAKLGLAECRLSLVWLWAGSEAEKTDAIGPLFFWSYIYYLSKYYELLDTLLQMARGKPPPHFALHVYHHACVLMMAWAWCEYQQTLQFGGLIFNTAVHVVMYLYFFLRVIGRPPWWKPLVTYFQIVQFATSLICFVVTAYLILGEGRPCKGQPALLGNVLFNVTLLYQFFGVSETNSRAASKAKAAQKKGGKGKKKAE